MQNLNGRRLARNLARQNADVDGPHDFDRDHRDHLDPANIYSELARTTWGKAPNRAARRSRPVLFDAMHPTARASSQAAARAAKLVVNRHSLPTKILQRSKRGDLVAA